MSVNFSSPEYFSTLNFAANCTIAFQWFNSGDDSILGSSNDTAAVDLLRSALPSNYSDAADSQVKIWVDEINDADAYNGTLFDDIFDVVGQACVIPRWTAEVPPEALDWRRNCTTTSPLLTIRSESPYIIEWKATPWNGASAWGNQEGVAEAIAEAMPVDYQNRSLTLYTWYGNWLIEKWEDLDNENEISKKRAYAVLDSLMAQASTDCLLEICQRAGFTGNPDVNGIGVLVSYVVEISIMTLLIFYHYFRQYSRYAARFRLRIRKSMAVMWYVEGPVRAAKKAYFDSAVFWAYSVMIAAFVLLINAEYFYDVVTASLTVFIAGAPLVSTLAFLQTDGRTIWRDDNRRPHDYTSRLWLTMVLHLSTVVITAIALYNWLNISDLQGTYRDYACFQTQFRNDNRRGFLVAVVLELFVVLVVLVGFFGFMAIDITDLIYSFGNRQRLRRAFAHRRYLRAAQFFVMMFALLKGWLSMSLLWASWSIEKRLAGDSWQELNWGFGQVLALFVWAPVLFEFVKRIVEEFKLRKRSKEQRERRRSQDLVSSSDPDLPDKPGSQGEMQAEHASMEEGEKPALTIVTNTVEEAPVHDIEALLQPSQTNTK
ncbi:hypothetical protein K402DRAFT_118289 [Aulographum hederae CBS 113979]|uniref:Uncharacterized protein n=1 Tax=Aulographum hederae CBS 113979 TaxID=1176131 RepID=A0A6G1GWH3_9PEZI|nr:hypothetical protein K402DRAFT_118289 [Aulographum hederae CBS 113979]